MKKADAPTWNYSVEVSAVESPRENMHFVIYSAIHFLSDYLCTF